MATAKRLYLYIVSAVGLGLVLAAATTLLRLLLDQLGIHPVDPFALPPFNGAIDFVSPPADTVRESLSTAVGLLVVGLPLLLIHWGLVERLVRGDGVEAQAERQSIVRSFFFAAVLGTLLVLAATSTVDVIREGLARPLGAFDPYARVDVAGSAAWAVSFWAAWIYFARVRARDLRQGPTIRRAAAWISRFYLYGAAFVGLVVAVVSLTAIIGTFLDLLARPEGMGNRFGGQVLVAGLTVPTAAWWVRPVLAAAAMAVIWGYLWIGHWLYTDGLNTRGDEQGQEERASRVRIAFFIGLVAVGVGLTASAFGQGIGALVG